MTRALATGLVAFVTLSSTCTKAGSGASDRAGNATKARAANAKARRIDLLTVAGMSLRTSFLQSQTQHLENPPHPAPLPPSSTAPCGLVTNLFSPVDRLANPSG